MKLFLVLLGAFVFTAVQSEEEPNPDLEPPEDEGKGFELTWTQKDAEDCPKNYNLDTSSCWELNVGDVINVPTLDGCVAYAKVKFAHDEKYDVKEYCTSHRRGCLYMKMVRDAGEEPAYWLKSMCAMTASELWSNFASESSGSGDGGL